MELWNRMITQNSAARWVQPEWGLLLLILVGVTRIAATYPFFSQTVDEPSHIACGMELLDKGEFKYEPKHPPLARVAAALGPYLAGSRSTGADDKYDEGNKILYSGDTYLRTLTLARMGILPFFVAATLFVWFWASELYSKSVALAATFVFTMAPGVLAHSGLATTDMAITATLAGALYAFHLWIENPTLKRSLWLGAALGFTVMAKLSAPLFLPGCMIGIVALHRLGAPSGVIEKRPWLKRIGQVAIMAFLVIWPSYRFSVAPFSKPEGQLQRYIDRGVGKTGSLHDTTYWILEELPLPAIEVVRGVAGLGLDALAGHSMYLLGQSNSRGWWYLSLVAIAVKTPLPFLILIVVGVFETMRRQRRIWRCWAPLACAVLVLLVCLPSKINLGLRHVLPIYPMLAIVAGYGLTRLWQAKSRLNVARAAALLLVIWYTTGSARAYPDYLAYFNEIAADHPEDYLVDCDLDWGQGLFALSDELRLRRITSISLAYFGSADPTKHGLPAISRLQPRHKTSGWIAISLTRLKMGDDLKHLQKGRDDFSWLESYTPVALIRKSILLYYIPPFPQDQPLEPEVELRPTSLDVPEPVK